MSRSDVSAEFRRRIRDEFLPQYLIDCGYEAGGYTGGDEAVPASDAEWFLRSLDEGVVELLPKATLKLPASTVKAMIFWEHNATISPRPVSLHLEGVLSSAMAARLHFEHGWPREQLGFEYPSGPRSPGRRAFDLGATDESENLVLAGEAKNTRGALDHLFEVMGRCAGRGEHEHPKGHPDQNGHNKWIGLLRCRPLAFFTFGPGEDPDVFRVTYGHGGQVSFDRGSLQLLDRKIKE